MNLDLNWPLPGETQKRIWKAIAVKLAAQERVIRLSQFRHRIRKSRANRKGFPAWLPSKEI